MSFSRHVLTGAGLGLGVGGVFSLYSFGKMHNPQRKNNDYATILNIIDFGSAIFVPSVCALGGAVAGAGLFGAKKGIQYLRHAPKPIQLATATIFAALFVSTVAYQMGKKN